MKNEVDSGAAPNPEKLTVREFLSWFGYARRGRNNVSQIRHSLAELDLRTIPDFEFIWIDEMTSIELDPDAVEGFVAAEEQIDPTVRIGAIDAANRRPTTVDPSSPLSVATTLMQMNDFSQLPVIQRRKGDVGRKRDVRGAISWKSIGTKLSLRHECEFVRDCMDTRPPIVEIGDPLSSAIGHIAQHGYILVEDHDTVISGIVTWSDLSDQFIQLAGPFLSLGEIEGYLRILVDRKFTPDEMREASTPSAEGEPAVSCPADLTLGGYCQLLGREDLWQRLSLYLDRKEFLRELHWIREKRNDIMHLNPEGLEPKDARRLEKLAGFFRDLRPMKST